MGGGGGAHMFVYWRDGLSTLCVWVGVLGGIRLCAISITQYTQRERERERGSVPLVHPICSVQSWYIEHHGSFRQHLSQFKWPHSTIYSSIHTYIFVSQSAAHSDGFIMHRFV